MSTVLDFPTEHIDLPSKGLLYPKESALSSGTVELRYMRSKEEDILTNQNYIQKGIVIDKLLQSLIVDSTIDYGELLLGDKNALLVAARILGYGKEYEIDYLGKPYTVDLSQIQHKEINLELFQGGTKEFSYTLPATGTEITFKLLTHKDEKLIDQELTGLKKIQKDSSPELSTRLKYIITSVGGNREIKEIRQFVDNRLLARDARALRQYIQEIQPDLDLKFYPEDGPEGGVQIPIGLNFFWPDINL